MQLAGLRADLVPHRQWALRKWYYANPLWYYHRQTPDDALVTNRKFYQLVDPELKDLCHLLNDHAIHTTPSCQGHFYGRERFENIWSELQKEALLIPSTGLAVRDSETDQLFLFHDPHYRLPWPSFPDFYAQAADHQGTGYLGLLVPLDRDDLKSRFDSAQDEAGGWSMEYDPAGSRFLGYHLFHILVHPQGPEVRPKLWKRITDRVRTLLGPVLHPDDARPGLLPADPA